MKLSASTSSELSWWPMAAFFIQADPSSGIRLGIDIRHVGGAKSLAGL
jgi:hypothetical protein